MADGPGAAIQESGESTDAGVPGPSRAGMSFRRAIYATMALFAVSGGAALLIAPSQWYPSSLIFLTLFWAEKQDIPVAIGVCAVLALLRNWPLGRGSRAGRPARFGALGGGTVLAGLAAFVAMIWAIRLGVLFDHDYTRDEQMAVFDARIFAQGRLYWPFPAAMKPLYSALNDLFTFPIGDREGWVSAYLPVNAAIRALLGQIMPLSLVSPLLAGVGGLALWRIAMRLWPADRGVQLVVLAGYATSSQVILTGTAAFAMTTHLALNLVWLALFLRGTRAGHAGALATGLLATGIHQPVFHPLFVLPFLDMLRRQRRWRLLAVYIGGYLVIGLIWLAWPRWLASHGVGIMPGAPVDQQGYIARLADMLTPLNPTAVWLMAGNLLRFVTWQHLLVVPLALVGTYRCAPRNELVRALALGLPLTFVAMLVLLPPQGHGWGYRYLHGLIGSLCLLAGYGWCWLRDNGGAPVRAMQVATALSLLVILPVHAAMVRAVIAPYARATQGFATLDADYVVVDTATLPFGTNFVLNQPDLANRPRMLLGSLLMPGELARLCPGRTIAFADAPAFAETYRFYLDPVPTAPSRLQQIQKRVAQRAGCRVMAAPVR